jgi:hypothetical protein
MRTLVGKQVFLDRERFVITGDRIEELSHVALGPLHSAAAARRRNREQLETELDEARE